MCRGKEIAGLSSIACEKPLYAKMMCWDVTCDYLSAHYPQHQATHITTAQRERNRRLVLHRLGEATSRNNYVLGGGM